MTQVTARRAVARSLKGFWRSLDPPERSDPHQPRGYDGHQEEIRETRLETEGRDAEGGDAEGGNQVGEAEGSESPTGGAQVLEREEHRPEDGRQAEAAEDPPGPRG